jgi:hypothetical protein
VTIWKILAREPRKTEYNLQAGHQDIIFIEGDRMDITQLQLWIEQNQLLAFISIIVLSVTGWPPGHQR